MRVSKLVMRSGRALVLVSVAVAALVIFLVLRQNAGARKEALVVVQPRGIDLSSALDNPEIHVLLPGQVRQTADAFLQSFVIRPVSRAAPGEFKRLIWFFWDGPVPPLVLKCFHSWQRRAAGWDIRGINLENVRFYLDEPADLPASFDSIKLIQRKSDCIRYALMYKFGGVWTDATIILSRDLEEWVWGPIVRQHRDLVGFYLDKYSDRKYVGSPEFGVFENWFFAAPAGTYFFMKVRNVLNATIDEIGEDFEKSPLLNEGRTDKQKVDMPVYLFCHIIVMNLRAHDARIRRMFAPNSGKVELHRAEDSAYFVRSRSEDRQMQDFTQLPRADLDAWESQHGRLLLVKFTGKDRTEMQGKTLQIMGARETALGQILLRT